MYLASMEQESSAKENALFTTSKAAGVLNLLVTRKTTLHPKQTVQ
jgi:hypothetical protein